MNEQNNQPFEEEILRFIQENKDTAIRFNFYREKTILMDIISYSSLGSTDGGRRNLAHIIRERLEYFIVTCENDVSLKMITMNKSDVH